ncbi:unnamed protein product [Closterium sp. Naga37s-1]|nr:unnamed protein product [Closterium sp. Naga37s-1]
MGLLSLTQQSKFQHLHNLEQHHCDAVEIINNEEGKAWYIVLVKPGRYVGNVEVERVNVVLLGSGAWQTVITGNHSNGAGFDTWDTPSFGQSLCMLPRTYTTPLSFLSDPLPATLSFPHLSASRTSQLPAPLSFPHLSASRTLPPSLSPLLYPLFSIPHAPLSCLLAFKVSLPLSHPS